MDRVAASSLSPRWHCRLLYHLVRHFRSQTILELGTSLGISTLYLHLANPKAELVSIEGRASIWQRANQHINQLGNRKRVRLLHGSFAERLPEVLPSLDPLDLYFIDGDHRYEAVLANYHLAAAHLHAGSVVIVHDIYWSRGMTRAWHALQERSEVKLSVDLYHLGLLFYDTRLGRVRHETLIRWLYKPWRMGFFASSGVNDRSS